MSTLQRKVSSRYLEVLDELIKRGIVKSVSEFCRRLNYAPQSMSQIRAGKRDVNIELVVHLYTEYRGNPVYVLLGTGEMVLERDKIPTISKKSVSLDAGENQDRLVERLEELLESKNQIISLLRKEIDRLTSDSSKKSK